MPYKNKEDYNRYMREYRKNRVYVKRNLISDNYDSIEIEHVSVYEAKQRIERYWNSLDVETEIRR